MSKQMSAGVMIALRPVICQDIGFIIQKIIKDEYHKEFKNELIDSVYKFVIVQCENERNGEIEIGDILSSNINFKCEWSDYRQVCFPNEIGCNCCDNGFPVLLCKKKWCKHQECICNLNNNNINYWSSLYKYCICDSPYRRQYNNPETCRDTDSYDYNFFQKMLLKKN
jgi:hypothetical protein